MRSEDDNDRTQPLEQLGEKKGTSSSTFEHRPGGGEDMSSHERIQLYKPAMTNQDWKEMNDLLDRDDLTEDDFYTYLSGGDLPPLPSTRVKDGQDRLQQMRTDFHTRRRELRDLSHKLATGEARIDEDGRLVPSEPPRPPNANLPPPPPFGRNNNNHLHRNENRMVPLVEDLMLNGHGGHNGQPGDDDAPNLTFRRICFAVLAVVTAFVCVILRTLPLMQEVEGTGTTFDSLLHELLHVKFMKQHLKHCANLDRDPPQLLPLNATTIFSSEFWHTRLVLWQGLYYFYSESNENCNDGVLHIPPHQLLADEYWYYSNRQEAAALGTFRQGVDHVWKLQCATPPPDSNISKCYPGWNDHCDDGNKDWMAEGSCPSGYDSPNQLRCFRGVHDGVISQEEALAARNLGHRFILAGGDHFDMHYNGTILQEELPTIMQKLRTMLREKYFQRHLQPVAFRFQTVGPMDFVGVDLNSYASVGLNVTNYLNWGERCRRQNDKALFSLPWPFQVKPVRDACKLMADLEADPRFAVHTSVFLSTGAGEHYRGGVTLFADNHGSNYRPKHKIRRGVTVDGSLGRVVVSSGGIENRRCRMPTRAGLRRVLQIWWGCGSDV